MGDITKGMRQKRFSFKDGSKPSFIIETKTGKRLELEPINCSLSGIQARAMATILSGDGFESGDILPLSKLTWEGHEITLGRLVVRNLRTIDGQTLVGVSTIDCRVPLDGPLSKLLEQELTNDAGVYEFELSPDRFTLADFKESTNSGTDLFGKCKKFNVFLSAWRETPRYMYRTIRKPSMGARVKLTEQRKGGRNDFLMMGSNDYLGLASHPEVLAAAKNAIDQYGFGSTGSPNTTGLTEIHEELVETISRTFKKEKAILFNSGYTANIGAITALTGAQDLLVADMLAHASIQDGMKMSDGNSRFFKHNDINHLKTLLEDHRSAHAGAMVITEGVFSMDGDTPPLDKIVGIAKDYDARTFVDEAHSFGVTGPNGLGAWEKLSAGNQPDIIMGTFSKICGGIGGFIAAEKSVVEYLFHLSRGHMFTVSIPPSTAAAALKAMQLFLSTPSLTKNIQLNIRHFVDGLRGLGFPINSLHESAVFPVVIGDEKKLNVMAEVLRDSGIFVVPVVFPAVSRKACRFRFTVSATHSISDLDYALSALENACIKADFSPTEFLGSNQLKKQAA